MSFGDFFSPERRLESIRRQFVPGQVFYLHCDFTRPPKPKYVVLACVTPRPLVLLINSEVAEFIRVNRELYRCQVQIRAGDYDFLPHDSTIDCLEAFEMHQEEIENQSLSDMTRVKGMLTQTCVEEIIDAVADSPRLIRRHQNWIINDLSSIKWS